MSRSLSEGQVQTLLQYLFNDRKEIRYDAIRHVVEHQWYHAQMIQALVELAELDQVEDVREAARGALRELEVSAV